METPHPIESPDAEINAAYDTKAEAYRAGYYVGVADQAAATVHALQHLTAMLQKNVIEYSAAATGEPANFN